MNGMDYWPYWGKAGKEGDGYHRLVYHCLDVAAVGAELLSLNTQLCRRFGALLALDADTLRRWVIFFLGLHDVGKFSQRFQGLRPDLFRALQGRGALPGSVRHDALGALLWSRVLRPLCGHEGWLDVRGGRRAEENRAADYWMATVLGHHGAPASGVSVYGHLDEHFSTNDRAAAETFFRQWYGLHNIAELGPLPDRATVKRTSWWLAGLAVLCDWLGSNRDYFPMVDAAMPLEDYWERARCQAREALEGSGLIPASVAQSLPPAILFGAAFTTPTPLQRACAELPLADGPQLFVLEDVTGAGKTEAALILANRLLAAGAGDGLYFALPTMATSNAMFGRMEAVYRHLFASHGAPSLVLAHGARRLHRGFRALLDADSIAADRAYGDGTGSAGARCRAWLADNPKKALLAEVGVGTIDQAVLAVLSSRHQALRLLGLLGKVLIVDEVHAYDAYLQRLLRGLITFHTAAGGSTILLSATLPRDHRDRFFDAYYQGLGAGVAEDEPETLPYPLLSHAAAQTLVAHEVATRDAVRRRVRVQAVCTEEDVVALLEQAVGDGRCAVWVRNTVNDAREAYRALRRRFPHWSLSLFHARFTLHERLHIEGAVLDAFGKYSGVERHGRVLIATQVVEQSLDLDFDVMVSDLAPIDLLIQRAGRLHRHSRHTDGTLASGPDQRGEPGLYIFAPPLVSEPQAGWIKSFLPGTAAVYPHHGRLWLGLRLLLDKGCFSMPDDARALIEGVYGDVMIPTGLLNRSDEAEGEEHSQSGLAGYLLLSPENAYSDTGAGRWWDEARTPTRLGDSVTVYLARWDGETLQPWSEGGDFPWQGSSLSVAAKRLSGAGLPADLPAPVYEAAQARLPAKGKWGVLLPLVPDESGCGVGTATRAESQVAVVYRPGEGLLLDDECGAC